MASSFGLVAGLAFAAFTVLIRPDHAMASTDPCDKTQPALVEQQAALIARGALRR